jgi:hypothetical protein
VNCAVGSVGEHIEQRRGKRGDLDGEEGLVKERLDGTKVGEVFSEFALEKGG